MEVTMVNYNELALELLEYLCCNAKLKFQKSTEDYTHGEIKILTLLTQNDNGISPGDICESLGMTTPRISAALASLTKKDLVTRVTDPKDKRRLHIYITESGKALVEAKKHELAKSLSELLSSLGEEDAVEYVRIMGKIRDNSHCLSVAE